MDLLDLPLRHLIPCLRYAVLVVLLWANARRRRSWVMRTLRRAFCDSRGVFSSHKEQRSRCRHRMLGLCLAVALPPILNCLISLSMLVFGLHPSPAILGSVLAHHINEVSQCPDVAKKLKDCFYVDDFITGAPDVDTALNFCMQSWNVRP